uniref:ParB-like nuclease domain protein n=1 Tax=Aliarcobacter butzleri TaxID=28197 RepID=W0M0I5_9BACT|nr:ParB/RepB/Spo0J family partition protein [Aliarcobacter butzleri]AHG28740.1 ParB-like nuclease domain protein [Aliarcobacter butzleri]
MPMEEINLDNLDFDEITKHNNFEKKDLKPLEVKELLVEMVTPDPNQPRKFFDEEKLQELSESIKEHGLQQPINVIDNGNGTYTILQGERRYRAHKLANLKTIKALVTVTINVNDDLEKQIIENTQRVNLSIYEEALSYKILWDSQKYPTKTVLAKKVSKKENYLSKMFSVLTIDEELLNHLAINNPKIGLEVLTEIAKVKDVKTQKDFYYQYIEGKITREDIRNRKKALVIGEGGEIIHEGQTTIKDILGEVEEAPVKTTKEEKQEETTTVEEVIKFDKKTKTILECHGFGTQNDLGTFISLHGDLEGAITIKEGRNKIEHSNNFNYKITIERIPVKK